MSICKEKNANITHGGKITSITSKHTVGETKLWTQCLLYEVRRGTMPTDTDD